MDAVFAAIGGAHLAQSMRTLRRGGRLVSYGLSSLPIGRRLPLQGLASAHDLLEHAQLQGKVVLLPNQ